LEHEDVKGTLAEVVQSSGLNYMLVLRYTIFFQIESYSQEVYYIPHWGLEGNQLDVRVVCPVQKKYVKKSTENALAAAQDAEKLKTPNMWMLQSSRCWLSSIRVGNIWRLCGECRRGGAVIGDFDESQSNKLIWRRHQLLQPDASSKKRPLTMSQTGSHNVCSEYPDDTYYLPYGEICIASKLSHQQV
jgi:hypothetical protein